MKNNISRTFKRFSLTILKHIVLTALAVSFIAFVINFEFNSHAYEYKWMFAVIKWDGMSYHEYTIDGFEPFKISYFREVIENESYEIGIFPYLTPELEAAIRDWGYPFNYDKISYVPVYGRVNKYDISWHNHPWGIG